MKKIIAAGALALLAGCGSAAAPKASPPEQPAQQAAQPAAPEAAATGTADPDVTGGCTLLYEGTGGMTFPATPAGLQQEQATYISPPDQVARVTITNAGTRGFTVIDFSIEVDDQGAVVGQSSPQQAGQFLAPGETFQGGVDLTTSSEIPQMSDAAFQSATCAIGNWDWQ